MIEKKRCGGSFRSTSATLLTSWNRQIDERLAVEDQGAGPGARPKSTDSQHVLKDPHFPR
jgi:hypothetical protein